MTGQALVAKALADVDDEGGLSRLKTVLLVPHAYQHILMMRCLL